MNEGTKTGVFWLIAVAMLSIAALIAWPRPVEEDQSGFTPGLPLFDQFTDPLAAASMRIVTFNEEQGQLGSFEVRKDSQTEQWTIPSRGGYPADAIDQMRDAANALVGLKILDIQTSNAEDHDDLGVKEPKMEDLEVGDVGVGRLVTLKDGQQETLATLIIGDRLKDDPEKRYVRIPGQDPVYVVKLNVAPLTTRFQDWIEEDLLQLSSLDIAEMEIKDYNAAINPTATPGQGRVSVTRNYNARVGQEKTEWVLRGLLEFDPSNPLADPVAVPPNPDQKLNRLKLERMKNALDDLRIVNVVRKPEGMSTNLRANQDLLGDQDAMTSLAQRGFYPVPSGPNGETELLSANGELSVVLTDGVRYIIRFGNIAGVTNSEDSQTSSGEQVDAGVNRFLLVTTVVDESKFPAPALKSVPESLDDLAELLKADGNAEDAETDLTEEELLERLEAEQEKITKENRRKLDARKDRLESARRRVRELNARFADWYYVIPEDTYSVLRIQRDELFGGGTAGATGVPNMLPPLALPPK